MTATVKVTYNACGSSDINMASDFTGIDIESTRKGLPLKKKELDSKLNVDQQKPTIESMTILQIRERHDVDIVR